ncbi:MAG: c-type cytochrome biogenesis protein CcmI [Rhodocyclales bacterium]|nr:c-type cytochrome biogenesis protein CcmI [Rhodocyclales bacterium]
MTGFFAAAAVAVAATLLLLLRPFFWRRAERAATSHKQLNAAIYRDQIAELARDRADGTLSEDDYRKAQAELQRRVLEDGSAEESAPVARAPKKTLLALALLLPAAAAGLYVFIGTPAGLSPTAPQRNVTPQEIENMVSGLAARLEKEPGNLDGWLMLARSYKAMQRFADAEKAFERAAPLVEQDAQLLAVYADVVAARAGGRFEDKALRLIDKALKLDPDNLQALWLSGSAAFEQGRYDKAVAAWEHLLRLLPANSEDAQQLAAGIAEARSRGGKGPPAPSGANAARR